MFNQVYFKKISFLILSIVLYAVPVLGSNLPESCKHFFDLNRPIFVLDETNGSIVSMKAFFTQEILKSVIPRLSQLLIETRGTQEELKRRRLPRFKGESSVYRHLNRMQVDALQLADIRILLPIALTYRFQKITRPDEREIGVSEKEALLLLLNHPRLLTVLATDVLNKMREGEKSQKIVERFLADLLIEMSGNSSLIQKELDEHSRVSFNVSMDNSSNFKESSETDKLVADELFRQSTQTSGVGFPIRLGARKWLLASIDLPFALTGNSYFRELNVSQKINEISPETLKHLKFLVQIMDLGLNRSKRWNDFSLHSNYFNMSTLELVSPISVTVLFYNAVDASDLKLPEGVEIVSDVNGRVLTVRIHKLSAISKLDNDLRIKSFQR